MDFAGLDFLVVGAGLSGLTIAERLHAAGRKVAVIERSDWIGGLAAAYTEPVTGIEVHRHGTHVFHTDDQAVSDYFYRFDLLTDYRHRVLARHSRRVYPWPVNLLTINSFFGLDMTPRQAAGFLRVMAATDSCVPPELLRPPEGVRVLVPPRKNDAARDRRRVRDLPRPNSLRAACIAGMGLPLYEAFVEGYSRKQWGCDPSALPPELCRRIPVRCDYGCDLFADAWQGLPLNGYERLFGMMASGIAVHLGVDFFDMRHEIPPGVRIVYTGPLDRFFDFAAGPLAWRGVHHEVEVHPVADFQGAAVINECDAKVPYTRTHEFKHLRPERRETVRDTVISREYPTDGGDPAYPVEPNGAAALAYQDMVAASGVTFAGRLATYRYLNMDEAIAEALAVAETLCRPN